VEFSVIIAAYNRCDSLRRLLASIAENFDERVADYEVIIANNARDPKMAAGIAALAEEFRTAHGDHFRHIEEPLPGKCSAQNHAIRIARGDVFAFFDDDVVVTPDWLRVAGRHFRESSNEAMQGPVLIPPEWQDDETFLRAHHKFKTINFARYSRKLKNLKTLTGANMAVRREVFSRIGLFNEALGPGRSGISEDVEFAGRLVRAGGIIGYEPEAAVYHEVDWNRLTEEFFRARHRQQGASRYLYKHQSLLLITGNLVRAVVAYGWYSLCGVMRKRYRAKGRLFHYGAMLEQAVKGPKAQAHG
jgi:GT2 family glycosyltransferase